MKYLGNLLLSFCILLSFITHLDALPSEKSATVQVNDAKKRNYTVRVLLQEIEKNTFEPVRFYADGFYVYDTASKTKQIIEADCLTIAVQGNNFLIGNTVYQANKVYLYPAKGHIKFQDKEYQGSMLLVKDNKNIYVINALDIEDYVCSVLQTESWPGWPLEVNKVFAIASRSYVIGVILANRTNKLPYHVKNTNKHQTYSGVHANQILKDAVEQTKGIFLAHNKKPIIAMFDSCCGGVIPAHSHMADFANAPYLARIYACTFCKDCKMYNWKVHYTIDQFEQILKKEYKQIKKLQTIKITKKDKAGLVQQINFKAHNKTFSCSGKKIYSMLCQVKSYCFDVLHNANEIIFSGRGIGHHMGLCQWGAREMVRQGYDHKSILSFYYPNTDFMRLQ